MFEERSPALVIILTFVTCGIYGLYWYYRTSADVQDALGVRDMDPALELLLIIVTCGLYAIYWWYRYGVKTAELQRARGLPVRDNALLLLLLSVFGLSIVGMAILQSDLNAIWRAGRGYFA